MQCLLGIEDNVDKTGPKCKAEVVVTNCPCLAVPPLVEVKGRQGAGEG